MIDDSRTNAIQNILCRVVLTDHGSFVLLNVYVPNAGKKEETISERADLKIRFLHALKEKCDSLREEGRKARARLALSLQ